MGSSGRPNLVVGLITTRDTHERRMTEAAGLAAHAVEVIATIENIGDALAGETTTRFLLEGAGIDRELRIVHTPQIPARRRDRGHRLVGPARRSG